MDKIIFDNVLYGFPADEKFMQMVDNNRLSMLEVCRGIFGDKPTVLRDANISQRAAGGRLQILISSGILWTGDDLVKIKQSHIFTTNPEAAYIKIVNTAEKNTFHDGSQHDAYMRNEGVLAAVEDGTPPTGKTIYLHTLRRVNICQSVVSDIEVSRLRGTGGQIKGTLKQTVYSDNRTNICGMIYLEAFDSADLSKTTKGIKVAALPSRNTDIARLNIPLETAYPATITLYLKKNGNFSVLFVAPHFITMDNSGYLYVHIPHEKLSDFGLIGQEITCAVAVDFTYNSK